MKKFNRYLVLSSILIFILLSGCRSVNPKHLEIRNHVISINKNYTQKFSVGETTIKEIRRIKLQLGASLNVKAQDINNALKINLKKYNLLQHDPENKKYKIDLEISLIETGLGKVYVLSIGKYTITNLKKGSSLTITINKTYTASPINLLLGKSNSDSSSTINVKVYQTKNYKKQLTEVGYAQDGTPLSAMDASSRWYYAHEGSIRLNIATFIETLNQTKLP